MKKVSDQLLSFAENNEIVTVVISNGLHVNPKIINRFIGIKD